MSYKRRRSTSGSNDVVDRVLEKASLLHSVDLTSIKQRIEEQLRLLKVKAPIRQFGKGDSMESRKLVLLELYLKSEGERNASISRKTLASSVGMKPAAFDVLCDKVKNHVRVAPKQQPSQSSSATVRSQTDYIATETSKDVLSSTIPLLSIRLGSLVQDSHGLSQRAEQLLSDLEEHFHSTTTISKQKKQLYLQDLQRSRAAYEAACFYHVSQHYEGRKKPMSNDNEDEDAQLSIQSVAEASSVSLSEVRAVLSTVQQFASSLSLDVQEPTGREMGTFKASCRRKRQAPARQNRVNASATSEGVDTASTTSSTTALDLDQPPTFEYSDEFLEWKSRIMKQVMDETVEYGPRISNAEAFSRAADRVLQQEGLC